MSASEPKAKTAGGERGDRPPTLRVASYSSATESARPRVVGLRLLAYALVFAAGAAAMVAYRSIAQSHVAETASVAPHSEPSQQQADAALLSTASVAQPPASQAAEPAPIALPPKDAEPLDRIELASTGAATDSTAEEPASPSLHDNELHIAGITEPAPGRFARLSLATSQAVAFVDVKPGDRVKKGWQVFSHWESPDRLQAEKTDLAKMKKLLEVARSQAEAAKQTATRLRRLKGDVTAQELQDVDLTARIRQQELEADELSLSEAESRYAAMEFEFKQAFVTSPIDGRVASVDVVLGERRQLGGAFRGVTVLDTRVLYCRCLLNPEQLAFVTSNIEADRSAGNSTSKESPDAAEVSARSRLLAIVQSVGREWPAAIATVGIQADPATGLIPLLLEVQNPDESLRSGVRVEVMLSKPTEDRAS